MEHGNYVAEQRKEEETFNEAEEYIKKATNKRPYIENIEIKEIQPNSVTIKVKAIDEDGGMLRYKIYIGESKENLEEKSVKEAEQGEEVELIATGINTLEECYYRIDVSDKYITVSSNIGELNNKKPVIKKVEVTDITRNTAKVKIKGTDEDGDRLVYKVYIDTVEENLRDNNILAKKESEEVEQGTEVNLDITEGLNPNTKYFYRIDITDQKDTVSSTIGNFTTMMNHKPVISETITRDIMITDNPMNSDSWIQIGANVVDEDGDRLEVKIYLGKGNVDSLESSDLIRRRIKF
ncbi:MAG: hypothetical protein HFJ54_04950 [Clostridia bacterium]|nr:hypothetical protein [Clostridia bacterium]